MTTPTSSTLPFKRGLLSALVFAGLLVLLLLSLNLFARAAESPALIGDRRAAITAARSAPVVFAGPSVATQFVPETVCPTAVNIAEPGVDIFELAAMGKHIARTGRAGQVWIVGLVPVSFAYDNGAPGSTRRSRRQHVYRTLQSFDHWSLIGGDWQGAFRAIVAPALGWPEWQHRKNEIMLRLQGRSRSSEDRRFDTAAVASHAAERSWAKRWVATMSGEARTIEYWRGDRSAMAGAALAGMVHAIRRRGGTVVIALMPISPAMRQETARTMPHALASARKALSGARAAGAVIVDDTARPRFADDLSSFRDPLHLNYQTGAAYTADLFARLGTATVVDAGHCPMLDPVETDLNFAG